MNVTNGSQLTGPFTGSPSSGLNLSTNTGPNALLVSDSYPVPSATADSGPLTTAPAPGDDDTTWRMASGQSGASLLSAWTSDTATYVYNDDPSNLGGIIPDGGLTIDGYDYPAGMYVFQFLDFSQLGYGMELFSTWPDMLLRGCRSRGTLQAPGFINMQSYTNFLALHYCDIGCESAAFCATVEATVAIDTAGFDGSIRMLRCNTSYGSTGIQPNASGYCEVIECFVEKLTYSDVGSPPVPAHLNGLCINGGNLNCLFLRNNVVVANPDENGASVDQTDCIALFQDFGDFAGTGTNSDDSTGYFVQDNYVGGTGYSFYCGQNEGTQPDTVNNLTFTGNQVTTAEYSTGGANGPVAAIPEWNSFGNTESANIWADGPLAGKQDIFGATVSTLTNTFAGGTDSSAVTAGNSGGASGDAFDAVHGDFGGTVTYSAAQSIHSGLSGSMDLASAGDAYVVWSTSLTSEGLAQVWFRMYCYIPAYASGFSNSVFETFPSSGYGADLRIEPDGTIQFLDSNGTAQLTMSTTAPTAAWFRFEGYVIGSATAGQMQLQIFTSPDSATPTETETSGSTVNTGGLTASVNYGVVGQGGSGGAFQIYLDGLGASSAGYIGPIVPPAPPSDSHVRSASSAAALFAAEVI